MQEQEQKTQQAAVPPNRKWPEQKTVRGVAQEIVDARIRPTENWLTDYTKAMRGEVDGMKAQIAALESYVSWLLRPWWRRLWDVVRWHSVKAAKQAARWLAGKTVEAAAKDCPPPSEQGDRL